MDIFKILGLVLITAIIALIFKNNKSEYALLATLCCSVIILSLIIKKIIVPITVIGQKIESYGVDGSYMKTALKALGIGYITSFISDACKDAGMTLLSTKAELAGKSAIFLLSVPLILSILETAVGLVQ